MPWEMCFGKIQAELLCYFSSKTMIFDIPWIEADDVVMRFDFVESLVFLKMFICLLALVIEVHRITENAIHIIFCSKDHSAHFIQDRFSVFFIMLKEQVVERLSIISILTCDVF